MKARWSVSIPLAFALACNGGEEKRTPDVSAETPAAPDAPSQPSSAPEAPAAPSGPQVSIDQLVPTIAGGDARSLFDGDAATGLRLGDDPRQEGVLVRFPSATTLDTVTLAPCDGASGAVRLYINGSSASTAALPATFDIAGDVRSLFVRAEDASATCLGSLSAKQAGSSVSFVLPRRVTGTVTATSTLTPEAAYHPAWLLDGRSEFAWVEGDAGLGVGTVITLSLDESVTVTGVEVLNGYQRSKDHFDKNARVGALKVTAGAVSASPTLADEMGGQQLELPQPTETQQITVEITEAIAGSKYKDLVISELRLLTADGPVELATSDRVGLRQANLQALASSPLGPVLDKQLRGHCEETWEGYASRTLKLRADHSFVVYTQQSDPMGDDMEEIFDGSWVPADGGKAVKLYGRRHTVRQSYSPYGSNEPEDTTRVAGGKLTVTPVSELGAAGFTALLQRWEEAGVMAGTCVDSSNPPYDELAGKGAVVLEGAALTDLLLP